MLVAAPLDVHEQNEQGFLVENELQVTFVARHAPSFLVMRPSSLVALTLLGRPDLIIRASAQHLLTAFAVTCTHGTWKGRFAFIGILDDVEGMPKMDWNRVEGNWKQVKGKVKEQWGKLTDDDLNVIGGRRDQLEGKIQERYGIAKDQARKDIDDWYNDQRW